ncbi:PD-(D/E)XK motif protein [Planctomycetota bacterium]|nr:PD-(D/E)XK motif protein [Planctomycetota bacterium]
MSDLGYDTIRNRLNEVASPDTPSTIEVSWLLEGVLGIGKSQEGQHAIILCGAALSPSGPSLGRVLSHGAWRTSQGEVVDANRLDLPAGDEFAMATATIAAELIRQGIGDRPIESIFPAVEDFIEQLIGRLTFSGFAVAGLLGELLLLKEILEVPGYCEGSSEPTSIWQGPKHDARDFCHGRNSVEVKTSLTDRRCHTIHSLDQVEPRLDENGEAKEALFLLSLGLRYNPVQGALSVPLVVDEILIALERASNPEVAKEAFLGDLSRWGSPGSPRYDHARAHEDVQLNTQYTISLEPRLFSVSDQELHLLRTDDLDEKIVERLGMTYRAEFPDSVAGSPGNPVAGWPAAVKQLLDLT